MGPYFLQDLERAEFFVVQLVTGSLGSDVAPLQPYQLAFLEFGGLLTLLVVVFRLRLAGLLEVLLGYLLSLLQLLKVVLGCRDSICLSRIDP